MNDDIIISGMTHSNTLLPVDVTCVPFPTSTNRMGLLQ